MQSNLVLPNTLCLFGFISELFPPTNLFVHLASSKKTVIILWKVLSFFFLKTIKLMADHLGRVKAWFQALLNKAGPFQFCPYSWDMGLIPKHCFLDSMENLGVSQTPLNWWESNFKLYLSSIRVAAKISELLVFCFFVFQPYNCCFSPGAYWHLPSMCS